MKSRNFNRQFLFIFFVLFPYSQLAWSTEEEEEIEEIVVIGRRINSHNSFPPVWNDNIGQEILRQDRERSRQSRAMHVRNCHRNIDQQTASCKAQVNAASTIAAAACVPAASPGGLAAIAACEALVVATRERGINACVQLGEDAKVLQCGSHH